MRQPVQPPEQPEGGGFGGAVSFAHAAAKPSQPGMALACGTELEGVEGERLARMRGKTGSPSRMAESTSACARDGIERRSVSRSDRGHQRKQHRRPRRLAPPSRRAAGPRGTRRPPSAPRARRPRARRSRRSASGCPSPRSGCGCRGRRRSGPSARSGTMAHQPSEREPAPSLAEHRRRRLDLEALLENLASGHVGEHRRRRPARARTGASSRGAPAKCALAMRSRARAPADAPPARAPDLDRRRADGARARARAVPA